MNSKYCLLLVACLLLLFAACKKSDSNKSTPLIVGKWQETKLTIHSGSGGIIKDTTFANNLFTDSDYIKFGKDTAALIVRTGDFFDDGHNNLSYQNWAQVVVNHYSYHVAGTLLKMTLYDVIPTPNNNAGPPVFNSTIVQLDGKNLVLHADGSIPGKTFITDIYYTRVQ